MGLLWTQQLPEVVCVVVTAGWALLRIHLFLLSLTLYIFLLIQAFVVCGLKMLSATSVKKDVVAIKPLATTAPPPTENPEGTQDGNRMLVLDS